MNGNRLRAAFHARQPVFGMTVTSIAPKHPSRVRTTNPDFIFIDTEHVPFGRETVSWMCQLYAALDIAPLVRIPAPDPYQACMAIDGGAHGIIVPYVESAEQVRALVGAVKFRPLKGKKLERILSGAEAAEPELQAYLDKTNANQSLIVQTESVDGIAALPDIAAVPGLDLIMIGPHDLTCSLGIPEQYGAPRFEEAVLRIVNTCAALNPAVGVGIQWNGAVERIRPWLRAGMSMFSIKSDAGAFVARIADDFSSLKRIVSEEIQAGE